MDSKQKRLISVTVAAFAGLIVCLVLLLNNTENMDNPESNLKTINLPEPETQNGMSIEKALLKRRSIREYKDDPLELSEISQLLWAAQGITGSEGKRTAPSAGALYPLELYIVSGNVQDLENGVYKYDPHKHELNLIMEGDKRADLYKAALKQSSVKDSAAVIVFSAVFERTTVKYGKRGTAYVYVELGHAAQNVFLQAVSLNLGAVVVGGFEDKKVKKAIKLPDEEHPLYLMPVGKK